MKINFKKSDKLTGIYCIENIINGVKYIGKSTNIASRLHYDKYTLNKNIHCNPKLQRAWNKYNEDNFICYILELCKEESLSSKEAFYINSFKNYNINRIFDENTTMHNSVKLKISKALKGKNKTKEHSSNIAESKCIKVYQYSLEGEFLKEWKSAKTVNEILNIRRSDITAVCRNKRNKAGEFIWRYEKYDSIPVYKRKKQINHFKNKRSKKYKLLNLETNEEIIFDSLKLLSLYLNTSYENLAQYFRKKIPIYKKIYKIDLVKSDKLLETPERDNQQPIISLND